MSSQYTHLEDSEKVFKDYYPGIVGFIERHVCDEDIARDLAQDIFIKLFESTNIFSSILSLKSWLYKCARHAALDYLRKLKVKDDHALLIAESMLYIHDLDEQINEELTKKINLAIDKLPEQCRIIIKMSVMEDKKYTDIASELNISINTVRKQVTRGYAKLRASLEKDIAQLILLYLNITKE